MITERKKGKASEETRLEYGKVVKSAELNEIVLLSSFFDADRGYLEGLEPDENGDVSLSFVYGADVSEVEYDTDTGALSGQFGWYARAEHDGHTAIDVRGSYKVVYECESELDEEAVRSFVLRVGRFATFPYFRQLVTFYASAGSLELPILPVLKE